MDSGYLSDWAFSLQGTFQNVVQSQFSHEEYRWPLKEFDAEGYVWKNDFFIVILRHKVSGIPSMGNPKILSNSDIPLDDPNIDNLENWHNYLKTTYSIRPQDALMIISIVDGKNVQERWNNMNERQKQMWHKQISMNITNHYYHLKGFDALGDFFIPPGYLHVTEECQQFLRDNPDYNKNVFIMMKFDEKNIQLKKLEKEIRTIFKNHGYNPVRADDKVYPKDRDLWNNVCVYMICCKQGIAILENKIKLEYNPNVAIEYGFMRALNKRALLLADNSFPKDRADIVGKIREKFEFDNETTVKEPIEKWLKEL